MSDVLIAAGGVSPAVLLVAALAIAIGIIILLLLAPRLSQLLLRLRARTLPSALSERLLEEWLAEVHTLDGRLDKLTFAVALALTRTESFVGDTDEAALRSKHIVISVANVMVPSDFTIRLVAFTLDVAIVLAASYGIRRLIAPTPHYLFLVVLLQMILWFFAMEVCFVQRFGGSPGKLLARLRIVTIDGTPLTYKHAFLRAVPNYFLSVFYQLVITVVILSTMTWADYAALAPRAQRQLARDLLPLAFPWFYFALSSAWYLGDIMAFVASDDRRALHDRLAGTIVVHRIPTVVRKTDALQPPASTSAMR